MTKKSKALIQLFSNTRLRASCGGVGVSNGLLLIMLSLAIAVLPTLRETIQSVLAVVMGDIGGGEMEKVMHSFPYDMQSLFPALAAATT